MYGYFLIIVGIGLCAYEYLTERKGGPDAKPDKDGVDSTGGDHPDGSDTGSSKLSRSGGLTVRQAHHKRVKRITESAKRKAKKIREGKNAVHTGTIHKEQPDNAGSGTGDHSSGEPDHAGRNPETEGLSLSTGSRQGGNNVDQTNIDNGSGNNGDDISDKSVSGGDSVDP